MTEDDWQKLEKAGWKLFGFDDFEYTNAGSYVVEDGFPKKKSNSRTKNPHYGFKYFNSITDALVEFEELTGQDVSEEGCNCCGAPHSFSWSGSGCIIGDCKCDSPHTDYHYGSGESLLQYLYPDKKIPNSLREAIS